MLHGFNCLTERVWGGLADTWRRQFRVNYTPDKGWGQQGGALGEGEAEHNNSSSIEYQKTKHVV